MLDPIGASDRIREHLISYLDTAFRLGRGDLTDDRRQLLRKPGTMITLPFIEPVPRYESWSGLIEDVLAERPDNPLPDMTLVEREAFVELVLSGLFPGEPADEGPLSRKSPTYLRPYLHQIRMLERGTRPGSPGIVTSGTGSGKTESFMLPILATMAGEAVHWPAPTSEAYLAGAAWWDADRPAFRPHRTGEAVARPQAVRALIMYPMNALVEDQMTRLRKSLDSDGARETMDRRFRGNRIFFGRYTSAAPVTGFLRHPRRPDDNDERKRLKRRTDKLARAMSNMASMQDQARLFDLREARKAAAEGTAAPEETRFIFPATDGGELVSRWDIQETPPDILVTNVSMLSTMLSREVEAPIFAKTRRWLETDPDAYFFLVLDELHLIRGSAGTEIAGLIRILIQRLGLDHPDRAHKLRILASSASLPQDGPEAELSTNYLFDFFADFGTRSGGDAAEVRDASFWKSCIVPGNPIIGQDVSNLFPLPMEPFLGLLEALHLKEEMLTGRVERSDRLDAAFRRIHDVLIGPAGSDMAEVARASIEKGADVILWACSRNGRPMPASIDSIAEAAFGRRDELGQKAARGLMILRGLGDIIGRPDAYSVRPSAGVPSFREHIFVRAIEGLFAAPSLDGDTVRYDGMTVERGVTYHLDDRGPRRLFELVYCEACGEAFVAGRRSAAPGAATELLPTSPNLEGLPDFGAADDFGSLSHAQFAIFWPSRNLPKEGDAPSASSNRGNRRKQTAAWDEHWDDAYLDARNGLVLPAHTDPTADGYVLPGRIFRLAGVPWTTGGTAAPKCCPSCGTDYSGRKPGQGARSPIRNFRMGFTKTSQILATELAGVLQAAGVKPKMVSFSDSRQDAARTALNIERGHHQDMRREILVTEIDQILKRKSERPSVEDLTRRIEAAQSAGDYRLVAELAGQITAIQQDVCPPDRVPLAEIVETSESSGPQPNALLARMVELGMHPIDDTGIKKIGADVQSGVAGLDWFEMFELVDGKARRLRIRPGSGLGAANDEIQVQQQPLVDEVLFSKTYFALEETGIGYPSVGIGNADEADRLDAYLRVLSDAYRVLENKWVSDIHATPWATWSDVGSRRVRSFVKALGDDPAGEFDSVLAELRNAGHRDGKIDTSKLVVRIVSDDHPYFRCDSCGRVHLHRGCRICTRCFHPLPRAPSGAASELWDRHFLGRKIKRGNKDGAGPFALHCEELSGQTGDPADRLRRFKEIFVGADTNRDEEIARRARKIDILSVTTTMEVGIDIGALQAVYQANMPPMRFNYQQRVGRAGRRGQAFSLVATLCRSRSHDLHYFRHPEAITGETPPPPFLTTDHLEIPLRLLRKAWLTAAFDRIRSEMGTAYPGDDVVVPDVHGEFVPCDVFYGKKDGCDSAEIWSDRLRRALEATTPTRDAVTRTLGAGKPGRSEDLLRHMTVDGTIYAIGALGSEDSAVDANLAQFLAEHALMPMYGMPTRVRSLYLGLERVDGRLRWDTLDRDIDVAIYEFAPGQRLVRDKRVHKMVGFTASLPVPTEEENGYVRAPEVDRLWYGHSYRLGECATCGGTSTAADQEADPVTCGDCGAEIPIQRFHEYVVPRGFRTSFVAEEPGNESLQPPIRRRTVSEVTRDLNIDPIDITNMEVGVSDRAAIFRLNDGPPDENGDPIGYDTGQVTQKAYPVPRLGNNRIRYIDLKYQFLSPADVDFPWKTVKTDGDNAEGIRLGSRKATDSLFIGAATVPRGLNLSEIDRTFHTTRTRAAAISATQLIIMRAALALDVAPEEFEILEPRVRDGKPLLQIADMLVNGSGFARRLGARTADGTTLVSDLIRSMTGSPSDDPLIGQFLDEGHRKTCSQACYRCMQRYGNRGYHGLLDWRLGLGYLRCFVDGDYRSGLDMRWEHFVELRDWPEIAYRAAEEIARLRPSRTTVETTGPANLPLVRYDGNGGTETYVIVHPLWRLEDDAIRSEAVFAEIARQKVRFINTFDALRRPMASMENAFPELQEQERTNE